MNALLLALLLPCGASSAPIVTGLPWPSEPAVVDDVREALAMMKTHQVRRLPVIDGHDLVGIISQADVALALSSQETGETVAEISE